MTNSTPTEDQKQAAKDQNQARKPQFVQNLEDVPEGWKAEAYEESTGLIAIAPVEVEA